MSSFLTTARRVIATEADALRLLESSLGDEFDAAVELILAATGRVIISGMGKSGHIAARSRQLWPRQERPHILSILPRQATAIWA